MKPAPLLILLFCAALLGAQDPPRADALLSPRIAGGELRVGGVDADIPGFNHRSIQYAIDALQTGGGRVILDPGTYRIDAPVRLRSGIRLEGAGDSTLLLRGKGVRTRYTVDADYGELKLTVEDPAGFEVGMKVQVTDDDHSACWDVSTARITAIDENVIYIDRGLIRDYRSDRNGWISNASSVIEILDAEDVSVSGLVVDGNREENYFADGCNSAGILIQQSGDILIDRVTVRAFNGEGISWQITERVTVRNSEIFRCGNTGLHPGTGSPFSVIENNDVHHNDRDGLFICWRVYESRVAGNRFHHNGRYGICTGHKDTDVVFVENHVFENGSDGIHLRPEREPNAPHRNTFRRNIIENNGADGGGYGFSIQSPARDLLLEENRFLNGAGTQKASVYIYRNGSTPALVDNWFDQSELGNLVFEKK